MVLQGDENYLSRSNLSAKYPLGEQPPPLTWGDLATGMMLAESTAWGC